MDNIDIIIENTVKNKIYEPYGYEQAILTALDNKRSLEIKTFLRAIIKTIITLFTGVVITLSAVFAKDIYNWIYNIFNPVSTGKGVINMAESGYLYNTNMDYLESNNNSIKVEYIMMDDSTLNIVFDLKTKEKVKEVYNIEISDLVITDEKNNIIYCTYDNNVYKKYCEKNGITYNENWQAENYTNGGYQSEIIEKSEHNIKFIYKMYSKKYPTSKELKMNFGNIQIIPTFDSLQTNEYKQIEGRWNINIDLPQDFYNRNLIKYNVENNTDTKNGITVEEIVASYTEMQIHLKVNNATNAINNTEREIDDRIDFILGNREEDEIIQNPTITNEKGNIFKISNATSDGNFSKVYRKNGDLDIYIKFSIAKYDYTDTLQLKMLLYGKNITIELRKV